MRIIAGSARGTRLAAPAGRGTRPTADRVREALFSIIQSRFGFDGTRILDICAGTGALGIEALSRGAESCCFIENNRQAVLCLRKNLEAARMGQCGTLLEMDAVKALELLARRSSKFDMIFFDPPYASPLYGQVPEMLSSLALVAANGLVVVECAARDTLPEQLGTLVKHDRRVYGDTALELYLEAE